MLYIFISYSSSLPFIAETLKDHVQSLGHRVWVDFENLTGGDLWERNITKSIAESDVILVMVTKAAIESVWVKREIEIAISMNKEIIPLIMEKLDSNEMGISLLGLSAYHFIDFVRNKTQIAYSLLTNSLDKIDRVLDEINPLINLLLSTNSDRRAFAADNLKQIGDSRAVPALINALRYDDFDAGVYIAQALGSLGDIRAVEPLINMITNTPEEEDDDVLEACIEALGDLGDPKAVDALIPFLSHKRTWIAQNTAIALGKIRAPKALQPLINLLRSADKHTKREVIFALANYRDPVAVDILIELLNSLNDIDTLFPLGRALAEIGGTKAEGAIIEFLQNKKYKNGIQFYIPDVLGSLKSQQALEYTILQTTNPDRSIRLDATQALAEIGSVNVVMALIDRLFDEDETIKMCAIQALGEIGDQRAIESLQALLTGEEVVICEEAKRAINKIKFI